MVLQRYRVAWSNWPGTPGVSTHYLSSSVNDYTAIRTFYQAIKDYMPNGLTFTFPSLVDYINEVDGKLVSSTAVTPGAPVTSVAALGSYSGVSGMLIRWNTSAVVNGNKVIGRTYLVPMAQTKYQNDGTPDDTQRTIATTAANALIAAYADGIKVWSRPFAGRAATAGPPPKPAIAARAGAFFTALSASIPDVAVVLRSRRT